MRAKKVLKVVLWLKVIITIGAWVAPLCLFSSVCFRKLGMRDPPPPLFARLLGAAFAALTVGYLQGIRNLGRGRDVSNVVWVGIVSNGLACLILLFYGLRGAWAGWEEPVRLLFWCFTFAVGAITAGLIGAGLLARGANGT